MKTLKRAKALKQAKTLKRAKALKQAKTLKTLKRAKTHGGKKNGRKKNGGGVSGFDTGINGYWSDIIYINNFEDNFSGNVSGNIDETIRYFVLCTDMMSKFYDYCKEYASRDVRHTFNIENNDFTKALDTFLEDKIKKNNKNAVKKISSRDLLFFPFSEVSEVSEVYEVSDMLMQKIIENEETCLLLSKYIRHMKKIIMGYNPDKPAHSTANKSFAKIYNPEYYPEWKELTWPKSELGLNKLLDQKFCKDIRSKKFTLAKNIPKNATAYPGFLELINHNDPIYTSFTIAEPITNTLHKYHNDLLEYLENMQRRAAEKKALEMQRRAAEEDAEKMQMQIQKGGLTRKSSFPISRKTRRRKQTSQ